MASIRACILAVACVFFGNSEARSQAVYYPPNASTLLKKTAEDVAMLLQKAIPGTVITAQSASSQAAAGIWLLYDSTVAGNEACHVTGNASQMKFSAFEDNGLISGIYRYLYQLGFRFYQPGSLWEKIPALSSPYKNIDTVYSSSYKYRTWFISGGHRLWAMDTNTDYNWNGSYIGANGHEWSLFMRRNSMLGAYRFQGHRNDVLTDAYMQELQNNPCYVASFYGNRLVDKSAVPDVYNSIAKEKWATAIYDIYTQKRNSILGNTSLYKDLYRGFRYNYGNVGLEVPDGGRWAIGADSSGCNTRVTISGADQSAVLANYTVAKIKTAYPGQHFQIYAYNRHADVPSANMHLDEAIDVQVPTAYQLESSIKGLMKRWYSISNNVSEYHYLNLAGWTGETPSFSYDDFIETAARLKQEHSQGIVIESSPAKFASIPLLRSLNIELLNGTAINHSLSAFCNDMFGAAGSQVLQLLQWMGNKDLFKTGSNAGDNKYIIPLLLKQLNSAVQLAAGEPQQVKQRLNELKAYMHYCILYYNFMYSYNATNAEKMQAGGNLCLYLARINKLLVVNSNYLISTVVSKFKTDSSFVNRYNNTTGSAYLGGNLPLITEAEIEADFQADIAAYLPGMPVFAIESKASTHAAITATAMLEPAQKINVNINYTQGADYYNRIFYKLYAPAAGSFTIGYKQVFEMEGLGQVNFLVEEDDAALKIIKDVTVGRANPSGEFTVNIPSAGFYAFTVSTKYKTKLALNIKTGGNYFFKDGAFLGNVSESYLEAPSSYPSFFYVPANIGKLYFSLSNAYNSAVGYMKLQDVKKYFVFKNKEGQIVEPEMSLTDSALFYLEVPASQAGSLWQLIPTVNRYRMSFVNISNQYWYGNRKACAGSGFKVSTEKLGDVCITKVTAAHFSGSNKWEVYDKSRFSYYENKKEVLLPETLSPSAIITLYTTAGCFTQKSLSDIDGYLQMRESCAAAALPADTNDTGIRVKAGPNPTTGMVYFTRNGQPAWINHIEIFDFSGRRLITAQNTDRINMTHLAGAMYWYRIIDGENRLSGKIARL